MNELLEKLFYTVRQLMSGQFSINFFPQSLHQWSADLLIIFYENLNTFAQFIFFTNYFDTQSNKAQFYHFISVLFLCNFSVVRLCTPNAVCFFLVVYLVWL